MSEEDNKGSLVNVNVDMKSIGDAGKALIEKVSGAIGIWYEPRSIVNKAEAEAKAQIIAAKARIEISEVQQRGFERLAIQEGRKQQNIENIIEGSLTHLDADARPANIDDDWITYFFDRASMVGDSEMQTIWAKLLAGEAKQVGSFSKRTIDFISTMSKREAEVFTSLCQFAIILDEGPLVYIEDINKSKPYDSELYFTLYKELESIGLISITEMLRLNTSKRTGPINIEYFGQHFKCPLPNQGFLSLGQVHLTSIGSQLLKICGAEPSVEFLNRLKVNLNLTPVDE